MLYNETLDQFQKHLLIQFFDFLWSNGYFGPQNELLLAKKRENVKKYKKNCQKTWVSWYFYVFFAESSSIWGPK